MIKELVQAIWKLYFYKSFFYAVSLHHRSTQWTLLLECLYNKIGFPDKNEVWANKSEIYMAKGRKFIHWFSKGTHVFLQILTSVISQESMWLALRMGKLSSKSLARESEKDLGMYLTSKFNAHTVFVILYWFFSVQCHAVLSESQMLNLLQGVHVTLSHDKVAALWCVF